jgi:fucose permease
VRDDRAVTAQTTVDRSAWRARIGVSALFLVNGAFVATILPRLPAIKAGLGLSNAELGTAIAAMPIGGLIAGGFAGMLIHRFGSGRLAVSVGVVYGLLLVSVGLAPSWLALAGAFAVLGAMDATMDAAENAHGIGVQRRYGRSILHAFHGFWSAGTMLGGVIGAVAAALAIPVALNFAIAGAILALVALGSKLLLLPDGEADAEPPSEAPPERIHLRNAPRLLRLLGPIALLGLLGVMLEDAAQTWSTVYLVDVLGLAAGVAAVAFVLYTGAMTVGRLTNDRWVDRWGDARIGRWGALLAAAGLGLVALAGPTGIAWIAFVGFIGVGIGASSMFPLMVDAAGSRPDIPAGHAVAIVSWLARAGFVIAPTLMGVAADAFGLSVAFLIPLAAALLVVALAPSLLATATPSPDRQLVEPTGY